MKRTEFEVRSPDGRRLLAEVAGPEDGELVVSHGGTPGSRRLYERYLREGAERGLRHVPYSRPGYEGSDRQPGRRFADCVPDTAAVVDALGVDSFYLYGHSGGAQHALACAALLPERVRSVATVACPAPRDAPDLDWLGGMGESNLEEFRALDEGDAECQRLIEDRAAKMLSTDGVKSAFASCYCNADRECLEEGSIERHDRECVERILDGGIWGWFDESKATVDDWGFDLTQVEVPLSIWHGVEDRFVPATHGEWLAERLPAASFHQLPGEGHASVPLRHYGAMLDELLAASA